MRYHSMELFRKKMRAPTWEDTKPLIAGIGHFPPTKGMTIEGQGTMVMVTIYAAAARLNSRDCISVGERIVVWNRVDLVDQDAEEDDEVMDPVAARRLFLASQATQPGRHSARAGHMAVQPAVAPRKQRLQEKV